MQSDEHLLSALRYIVRNPLRARLRLGVEDWPWTSHAATIGASPAAVVAVSETLSYLGGDVRGARRRYLDLVSGDDDPPGQAHPLIDGDDVFIERNQTAITPCPEHPRAYVQPQRTPLAELVSSRHDAAALHRAHTEHGYSMRQLATHLGCGVTTIHRRIRHHETRGTNGT